MAAPLDFREANISIYSNGNAIYSKDKNGVVTALGCVDLDEGMIDAIVAADSTDSLYLLAVLSPRKQI